MEPLVQQIQNSDLALGSGIALLVFFAIALQCVSTLAILAKEARSTSLAVKMFAGYFLFAYGAAVAVYQLTSLFT
jgi:ferrous iron transport protein B